MEYVLTADDFTLRLNPVIFEEDIQYPANTFLMVHAECDGFSGSTTMDIDIKAFRTFVMHLKALYDTLRGTAEIKESYGEQYLAFSADRTGHIRVSGLLKKSSREGGRQSMTFENTFDQTYLRPFVSALCKSEDCI